MNFQCIFLASGILACKGIQAFAPAQPPRPAFLSTSGALYYSNGDGPDSASRHHVPSALSPSSVTESPPSGDLIKSVNYFISRKCNYSCKFCFHTQKNVDILGLEDAKRGLKMLRDAGTEKVNFAGGEPFINDIMLGELCRYAHSLNMAVSIISNASLIRPYWMKFYGEYVDVLGVSIDSFSPEINAQIGRGGGDSGEYDHSDANGRSNAKNKHLDRALKVRQMCEEQDIIFKMNTVVCKLNWQEDMTEYVRKLQPKRWKCFQVLILEDENSGGEDELRDARDLVVSREQFDAFAARHQESGLFDDVLIPEPNDVMQNSYLLLDENMCFLDCSKGGKVPSESILDVGVEKALDQAGFDYDAFHKRGGIYEWTRERENAREGGFEERKE
mmetsp:Transcript_3302/g.6857  ORF Transcript_3302/g.6857 Transcript_3302/m.6857 type:complete len:388 (-) Transcript_3302:423-1586(-)|eukprot:CAMPEP_0194317154 /NCGR_PEP_ID=MMETSP0171-20130528/13899_1 /TAXON_ID=218684 /ORGANISM="Corethron pennatum, Strain L29A3" /LENGTH=387 /DNA_ID=CAMNT_0039073651 /DNA_START=74 /DNA_END=1237 /DNA_ORIENTATION=+